MRLSIRMARLVAIAVIGVCLLAVPATADCPELLGSLGTLGNAFDVAVSGGYAYVLDDISLTVIDVSEPSAPVEVGLAIIPETAQGVAVSGDYAYVATASGLWVIDVSTPSAPDWVGFVDVFGNFTDVAVEDGFVYLTSWVLFGPSYLHVIDVGMPSAPAAAASVEIPGVPHGVAVSGSYAYVADGDRGLRVIDVSTLAAPVEVGFVDTPGSAQGVVVSGSYAYVADGDRGLRVIDVSTPVAPVGITSTFTHGYARGVAVSGGYAYVAGSEGLSVIDVRPPQAPREVGFAITPDEAINVAVSGGHVFVAVGEAGLSIFSDCMPIVDPRECYIPAAAVAAGVQGAFFQTDLELNNAGAEEARVTLQWLPRGEDNSEPMESEPFTLAPGASQRFENVLTDVFGLEPDSLGALKLVASNDSVIGMSRTYNVPSGEAAGTFGQGLPAIRETDMIMGTAPQRILFLSENEDFRANVGCVNGTNEDLTISVGIFDDEGSLLETRTMELGPHANDQLNQVLGDWVPINGYVDVWADRDDALYTCYGSMLDNQTSDPTTILPQVPSGETIHVPAAALAAGAEGSFFTTDLDLNNAGSTDLTYELLWLPRGQDNSEPARSDTFSLAAGSGVRYGDVLGEVFGLEPDEVGALSIEASGPGLLAMSRTYNTPSASGAGTFGQELAGIAADRMIPTGVTKRILFLSENDDVRSNVGCVNGVGVEVAVAIDLYDSDGAKLETNYMMLPPYSNRQINGVFQDYAPINGYVDVRTYTPEASIYCYGSVLDNVTSDPTTVLPQ